MLYFGLQGLTFHIQPVVFIYTKIIHTKYNYISMYSLEYNFNASGTSISHDWPGWIKIEWNKKAAIIGIKL